LAQSAEDIADIRISCEFLSSVGISDEFMYHLDDPAAILETVKFKYTDLETFYYSGSVNE
jgi:hypothetical protein